MEAFNQAVAANICREVFLDAIKLTELQVSKRYEIASLKPIESKFGRTWLLNLMWGDGRMQPVWANR